MKYVEFRRHLGKAGFTVNDFAELIHVQPSSISNYAKKKEVPHTHSIIAVALGDAGDRGTDFLELLTKYGVHGSRRMARSKVTVLNEYRRTSKKKESK